MQVIFTEERQKETRSTAEYSHIPQAAGYRGRGQGEARMEVIKWDGSSHKQELTAALMWYIDDEDKELAKHTSYGDLGKALQKKHGASFHGAVNSDIADITGETSKITIAPSKLHVSYVLTWNKAAKLIHEYINTEGGQIMAQLEEMDLSVRSFNCLRRAGIDTVEALTGMTREQFRSTLNLGSNCMDETEARMKELGLSFREETALKKQYMTDKAQEALTVHAQIMIGAQMVENGLYQMAKGFKIMRDEKLYKELGYKSFEEYCETETGMTKQNVYRMISIAEKIPDGQIRNIDVTNLGIAKLHLLTTLTDEQREEIVQSADLESTTVKELKAKIEEITGERDRERVLKEDWQQKTQEEVDRSIRRTQELKENIRQLEQEIKELESRPIDITAVDIKETDEYKEMQDEIEHHKERISQYSEMLADEKKRRAEKDEQITRLIDEIRELEKRPIEVQGLDESQRRTLEFDIKFRAAAEYVRLAGEAVCGNDERERFLNLKALIDEVLSKKK